MRNMPLAIKRLAYQGYGSFFTQCVELEKTSSKQQTIRYAVMMRCVRPDQSSRTITMHYLWNGGLRLRLIVRKQELMIPLVIVLNALRPNLSDRLVPSVDYHPERRYQ